ncbi:MAG: biotin/lipoyl-binding protein [Holophagaceae bacterium]|nr:biotin/lipoyl-binding protein [Holophagaceae bacterium]
MKRTLKIGDESHELEMYRHSGAITMVWDGEEIPVDIVRVEPTSYSVIIDKRSVGINVDRLRISEDPDLHGFRGSYHAGALEFTLQDPNKRLLAEAMAKAPLSGGSTVKAQMPGKLMKYFVKEGEIVEEGQPLFILEAMKMENEYRATKAGRVSKIHAKEGSSLEIYTLVMTLEPFETKDAT